MSKKKDQTHYGGKQPRIDGAEKQRGANKPRELPEEDQERRKHPGYPGKE